LERDEAREKPPEEDGEGHARSAAPGGEALVEFLGEDVAKDLFFGVCFEVGVLVRKVDRVKRGGKHTKKSILPACG
jgi:hypothetical protein